MKKKIVLAGLCLLFIAGLFCYRIAVRTPPYPGRLVLDLTNNTWSEISGSFLCFENTNVRSVLPDIFPQERLILLAPTDIFDRPQKTQVFLEYNGKRYTLSDEYYFLNGDKWNTDVV